MIAVLLTILTLAGGPDPRKPGTRVHRVPYTYTVTTPEGYTLRCRVPVHGKATCSVVIRWR